MKAFVLCAGIGKRLLPYTSILPKPLFPVLGDSVVEHVLHSLKRANISNVAINLFHLGELIQRTLGDGKRFGLKISYFVEPELLGTGGGLKNIQSFLDGEEFFLLYNGDVYCDIDLNEIISFHIKSNSSATMGVLKDEEYKNIFALHVNNENRITGIYNPDLKLNAAFSGIHILNHVIFRYLPDSIPSCIIRDGYKKMIADREKVSAYTVKSFWSDIGTPDQYIKTNIDIFKRRLHK